MRAPRLRPATRLFLASFVCACGCLVIGVLVRAPRLEWLALGLMWVDVAGWAAVSTMARRKPPVPPRNVHMITRAGEQVPLDCVYRGRRNGIARWEITRTVPPGAQLCVDELPARTIVQARALRTGEIGQARLRFHNPDNRAMGGPGE